MEDGYVLVHVLEALVPGMYLGDNPSCEIVVGDVAMCRTIPSTLQSENAAFPTGEEEPVVHVRAFDSEGTSVGLVVVPVATLVPLEVWNVWYAMDESQMPERHDAAEVSQDEMPKMHLLLQFVSKDVAAEESRQVREMRNQDFLLRALQQLNASLEAKVLVHQGLGVQVGQYGAASVEGLDAAARLLLNANSTAEFLAAAATRSSSTGLLQQPTSTRGRATEQVVRTDGGSDAATTALLTTPLDDHTKCVEPYQTVIAAMQERQRLYDDQEFQIQKLTQALAAQEQKTMELHDRMREAAQRAAADLEAESERVRQVTACRGGLELQIVELQQELTLQKSRENSLQRHSNLLESELAAMREKCASLDALEEQAQTMQREVEDERNARKLLESKFGEQSQQLSRLNEETQREQQRATGDTSLSKPERTSAEALQLRKYEALARDHTIDMQMLSEQVDMMTRTISVLEGEVASYKDIIEREKQARKEVERKFEEEELRPFRIAVEESRASVRQAFEDAAAAASEAEAAQSKAASLKRDLVQALADLAIERRRATESGQRHSTQSGLQERFVILQEKNAELKSFQEEARRVSDRHATEIAQHARVGAQLCQERDQLCAEVGKLRQALSMTEQQLQELRLLHEQTTKGLATVRATADSTEVLHQELQKAQDELRELRASRNKLSQEYGDAVAKFKENTLGRDSRFIEMDETLQERNNEIKLLMYRLQELSSRYTPTKGDAIDVVVAKWVDGFRPAVPFFRLSQGLYLFGRRVVTCKVAGEKPVIKVGGTFIGFDKFLELHASEELERLLNFDMDERTGLPKFLEAQQIVQAMDKMGAIDEIRELNESNHQHHQKHLQPDKSRQRRSRSAQTSGTLQRSVSACN
uniref:GAR domain-containing protein n=1 Tax=Noctiluca scintillans TaxID=2966 RepID=A0A7S0ZUW8_NOCSC|mmetsp:Transcript_19734/g.52739  ORF Transcript_19734/g.52739 Transcript_19734/m.52739 type:complete len:878 (+) Transcript_19734:84-2717(+)